MCTGIRFTDSNGVMYFGRNLDWGYSYGEKVLVTPRNFDGKASDGEVLPQKYAVIGMGIVNDGFPLYFDCANEVGLAVAGLNFPGYAHYESAPVSGKLNVAAYEFPLWVACQFKSVDEACAALENTAIAGVPVGKWPIAQLHWFIGDAERSIVVEYTESGMHIYRDDVDVLTNQPAYPWHYENLRNYISLTNDFPAPATWRDAKLSAYGSGSGMRGLPGDYYSPSRFVRAAYLNANYPVQEDEASNVVRLFRTLSGTAMVDGAARMEDGSFERTIYTSGYSQATKTYYYATYDDPAIRQAALSQGDLDSVNVFAPN